MKTKATTWLAQIVAVLLAAGTASASSGLLSGNSCQGKISLEGGYCQVSASVSAETHQGCGEVSRWNAAELFVAPAKLASVPATQELAQEILAVGKFKPGQQVVTLMETAEGKTIVAGGATDLNAAQKAFARSKGLLVAEDLPGGHAEITAVATAGEKGLLPTRGVVTAKMCNTGEANCVEQLNEALKGSAYELKLSADRRSFEFVKKGGQ